MPAKSKRQERFLQMAAHNPGKVRKKNAPTPAQARRALGRHGSKKKGRARGSKK